ncbi:LacI family transcriptional regulator [Microvirga vignae]|uniref:LacI family transcriptional regulator n=1 Tax=Microvirga vignae TaxID=1225564 RepID=A0A0H1R622_9HYPH|nr:LacI family DNA-binding transcriptional regulator [Microvirga vignae]KLK90469.1 LacI family transcriptional regulator [Microvirga vignae]
MSNRKIRNMEEFAQATGISRPTLSKYFDNPQAVRKSTRERIEQALEIYQYRPSIFAVNMNRKHPRNIGIVVPLISDPFYTEIVRQIEMRCLEQGYWAVVLSSHGDPQLEARAIQTLMSLKIAGAIIAPLGFQSNVALIQDLQARVPLLYFDSRLEDLTPFVGSDNHQSVSIMTEYLCRTGAHPTYLGIPPVNLNAQERQDSYVATMERLGLEPIVVETDVRTWDFEEFGFSQIMRMIDQKAFPTQTILCASDRVAFGAMAAAYQRGLKVGRGPDCDLRIAGHDDHPLSKYMCPPLTTVAQDYQRMAATSFERLLAKINIDNEISNDQQYEGVTLLEAKLVMRDSA